MKIYSELREYNRESFARLLSLRDGIESQEDVLVRLSIDDMDFYIGFTDLLPALMSTSYKISSGRFFKGGILSYVLRDDHGVATNDFDGAIDGLDEVTDALDEVCR